MKRAVNALQNFGKSLYGPVLILPIVGLFIAFGNVLGNGNLAEYLREEAGLLPARSEFDAFRTELQALERDLRRADERLSRLPQSTF